MSTPSTPPGLTDSLTLSASVGLTGGRSRPFEYSEYPTRTYPLLTHRPSQRPTDALAVTTAPYRRPAPVTVWFARQQACASNNRRRPNDGTTHGRLRAAVTTTMRKSCYAIERFPAAAPRARGVLGAPRGPGAWEYFGYSGDSSGVWGYSKEYSEDSSGAPVRADHERRAAGEVPE